MTSQREIALSHPNCCSLALSAHIGAIYLSLSVALRESEMPDDLSALGINSRKFQIPQISCHDSFAAARSKTFCAHYPGSWTDHSLYKQVNWNWQSEKWEKCRRHLFCFPWSSVKCCCWLWTERRGGERMRLVSDMTAIIWYWKINSVHVQPAVMNHPKLPSPTT